MRRVIRSLSLASVFLVLALTHAQAQPKGLSPVPDTPTPPIIQGFPGLTREQVKTVMDHSSRIRNCFASEGKESLLRIRKRKEELSRKVKALCKAGKTKEAQALAIHEAKAIEASDDTKVIEKCKADSLKQMKNLPSAPKPYKRQTLVDRVPENVCDAGAPPVPPVQK